MILKVALFGRGPWAFKIRSALLQIPDVEIVWVAGRNWREIVPPPEFDAAIIATAAHTHAGIAAEFLARGKPCFIEKPMATTPADARAIRAAWEIHRPPVVVDHIPLYSPSYRELRNRTRDSRLLAAAVEYTGAGPYRPDVSPLWDYGPHAAAVAVDLMGLGPWRLDSRVDPGAHGKRFTVVVRQSKVAEPAVTLVFGNGFGEKVRRVNVQLSDDGIQFESWADFQVGSPLSEALDSFIRKATAWKAKTAQVDALNRRDLDIGIAVTELLHSVEGTGAWEV